MHRTCRFILGFLVATAVTLTAERLCADVEYAARRECYRFAEWVGIMDPKGDLGGQVAGFNFQRHPAWVHPIAGGIAGLAACAPGVIVGLLVLHRLVVGKLKLRTTVCGRCGEMIEGSIAGPDGAVCCPQCRSPL